MRKVILLLAVSVVGCASKPYKPTWNTSQTPVCIIKQADINMVAKCNGLKLDDIFKQPKQYKETEL
jgi:hypothetical protein